MKVTAYKCELCNELSEEKPAATLSVRYNNETDLMHDIVMEICDMCESEVVGMLNRRRPK
jgi:hypothetical protein